MGLFYEDEGVFHFDDCDCRRCTAKSKSWYYRTEHCGGITLKGMECRVSVSLSEVSKYGIRLPYYCKHHESQREEN